MGALLMQQVYGGLVRLDNPWKKSLSHLVIGIARRQ
jgi:hypothetical protein